MVEATQTAFTRTHLRYELSVTVGHITVTQNCADLEAAIGALERFAENNRGNRDAQGGVYDRVEMRTVASWSGMPKRKPLPTVADIYAKLIASGQPVSIIDGNRSLSFSDAAVRGGRIAA